jgi:hypothetical protein
VPVCAYSRRAASWRCSNQSRRQKHQLHRLQLHTSPLSLPLSPNVSRETIVNLADLVGSGMAELLGLSGVGGTLCPRCRESGSGALVGVGTPVLVGGRGRVLSGSGCVRTLYGPPYGYWWLRNYGGGGSWRGVLPTVGRVGEQKVNKLRQK